MFSKCLFAYELLVRGFAMTFGFGDFDVLTPVT